jgi:hypothetical protein
MPVRGQIVSPGGSLNFRQPPGQAPLHTLEVLNQRDVGAGKGIGAGAVPASEIRQ